MTKVCQLLTLAISPTTVTYRSPFPTQACKEVKAEIERDAQPGYFKHYHNSSDLISGCAANGKILHPAKPSSPRRNSTSLMPPS